MVRHRPAAAFRLRGRSPPKPVRRGAAPGSPPIPGRVAARPIDLDPAAYGSPPTVRFRTPDGTERHRGQDRHEAERPGRISRAGAGEVSPRRPRAIHDPEPAPQGRSGANRCARRRLSATPRRTPDRRAIGRRPLRPGGGDGYRRRIRVPASLRIGYPPVHGKVISGQDFLLIRKHLSHYSRTTYQQVYPQIRQSILHGNYLPRCVKYRGALFLRYRPRGHALFAAPQKL